MIGRDGAAMVPCSTDPAMWSLYRVDGNVSRKATAAEIHDAAKVCLRLCRLLDACRELPGSAETVQAGVLYDSKANPTTIDGFLTAGGHLVVITAPPEPLRPVERVDRDVCAKGHEQTPENTRLDRNGFRYCFACRSVGGKKGRQGQIRTRQAALAPARQVLHCGTVVGAEAHYRRNEPLCDPCWVAADEAGLRVPA